jgi:peptidoglycan hydrolase-like amidase
MSQYGAYGRAKNGKSAGQILETYYKGAKVTDVKMPSLRVGLLPAYGGSSLSSISFSSVAGPGGGEGKAVVKAGGVVIAEGRTGDSWRAEAAGSGGFRLYKNGEQVRKDGLGIFGSSDTPLVVAYQRFKSMIGVTGKSHRYPYGTAEISSYPSSSCDGGMCARIVLRMGMQRYLYGLGEVPSSWPAAVLAAQAIAGRTYAYEKVVRSGQNRYPCGCAVHDTVIDQAYIGDSKRTGSGTYWSAWKGAVDQTLNKVVMHSGAPIQALYSSSSGGHTENNENVWGGVPIPYLRGVPDSPDKAGGANPNFKWEVSMSWSTFESKLNTAFGTGTLQDFQLLKPFGVSGRVSVPSSDGTGGARIVGSRATVYRSGWNLRSALGLKDSLFRVDLGSGVGEPVRSRYAELDGAPGAPTGQVYKVPRNSKPKRGVAQDFEKGRLTKHWSLGRVVWQWGPILRRYDAMGREGSSLKMPRSDVWGSSAERGAKYNKGRILWSKGTGARAIQGAFEPVFVRTGGSSGRLGLPTADRKLRTEWPSGGRSQRFQKGTIYLRGGGSAAFALWGPIDERYQRMGEAAGRCGYPVGDAQAKDGGLTAAFEHGTIVWSPATGIEVRCGS